MKKYQSSIGDRSKTKIYGFIPVRMKASRLPGKPLIKILNKTMLEHVFERAKMYNGWDQLIIATCDKEIMNFAKHKNYPSLLNKKRQKRFSVHTKRKNRMDWAVVCTLF